jgi:hypothetical protein
VYNSSRKSVLNKHKSPSPRLGTDRNRGPRCRSHDKAGYLDRSVRKSGDSDRGGLPRRLELGMPAPVAKSTGERFAAVEAFVRS